MLNIQPDKPIDPGVLDVLEYVQASAVKLGIPCLLIGARAIDIQLHNVHGLATFNPTKDTDFAVAVENWKQFGALKNELIKTGHFTPDPHEAQRLSYEGISPIDLVI